MDASRNKLGNGQESCQFAPRGSEANTTPFTSGHAVDMDSVPRLNVERQRIYSQAPDIHTIHPPNYRNVADILRPIVRSHNSAH